MTYQDLISIIRKRRSFLCVGLDTDPSKVPAFLHQHDDPVFEFNRRIIDATREYCVAYKLNSAFYEARGAQGWATMTKTFYYIGDEHFKIADAKRGDIGNTCDQYARAFFVEMNADAVTLAPYMGRDSIMPFLKYRDKFAIVLGLTSNESAADFELEKNQIGDELFKTVIRKTAEWGTHEQIMFVAGATKPQQIRQIREIAPKHFLLVPGVGAQGGSLHEVTENGLNSDCGLLVNSSRSIIYAGKGEDFDAPAAAEAAKIQAEMAIAL